MASRADEQATGVQVIDETENGVGWIAHPREAMRRTSHALAVDGDLWVVDPVDAEGVDDILADHGEVAGVVVALDRHRRDAAAIADRHDVPIYLPDWFDGVAEELPDDAPIVRFGAELADTGIEAHVARNGRFWQEVALYDPETGTLVVPESVGTASFFITGEERLGVHPMLRAVPPRDRLSGFDPSEIRVGHGAGIETNAPAALDDALAGSRRRMPRLYAGAVRRALPF